MTPSEQIERTRRRASRYRHALTVLRQACLYREDGRWVTRPPESEAIELADRVLGVRGKARNR